MTTPTTVALGVRVELAPTLVLDEHQSCHSFLSKHFKTEISCGNTLREIVEGSTSEDIDIPIFNRLDGIVIVKSSVRREENCLYGRYNDHFILLAIRKIATTGDKFEFGAFVRRLRRVRKWTVRGSEIRWGFITPF